MSTVPKVNAWRLPPPTEGGFLGESSVKMQMQQMYSTQSCVLLFYEMLSQVSV